MRKLIYNTGDAPIGTVIAPGDAYGNDGNIVVVTVVVI